LDADTWCEDSQEVVIETESIVGGITRKEKGRNYVAYYFIPIILASLP
jgi:hypothetical protein